MKRIMCLILATALLCFSASAYADIGPEDEETLYTVSVSVNNPSYGSAKASLDEAKERPLIITEEGAEADAEEGAEVDPEGVMQIDAKEGAKVNLEATPNGDCEFDHWEVSSESPIELEDIQNPKTFFIMPDADVGITAVFNPPVQPTKSYPVMFYVSSGKGSISAKVDNASIDNGDSIDEGSTVIFKATPATGYVVDKWLKNDAPVIGNPDNTYTLEDLSEETEVSVEFIVPVIIPTAMVTYSVIGGENGGLTAKVDGGEDVVESGDSVPIDEIIVFTASPDNGFRVKQWIVDGNAVDGKEDSYTSQPLSADLDVNVVFEEIPDIKYKVTFGVTGENGGLTAKIDGGEDVVESGELYTSGVAIVFTADPDDGFRVKQWVVNDDAVDGKDKIYTSLPLSADLDVKVAFEEIPDPDVKYTVTFGVNGTNGGLFAKIDGGSDISSGDPIAKNEIIVFTANPSNGFTVKQWIVNGDVITSNATTYTSKPLSVNLNVNVEFEVEGALDIEYKVTFGVTGANGSLTAKIDGGEEDVESGELYASGVAIIFTAQPIDGYKVKQWIVNGDPVSGSSNSYTSQPLSADLDVKVEFKAEEAQDFEYKVTFGVTGANGSLSARIGGGEDVVESGKFYASGVAIIFTAQPVDGYKVKQWVVNGDPVSGSSNSYTSQPLSADLDVKVEFVEAEDNQNKSYVVEFSVTGGNNGSLSATVDGKAIKSGDKIPEGKDVLFTATANTGYSIKQWILNGAIVPGNTSSTNTLKNITARATVYVQFSQGYIVSFGVTGSGSLTAKVDGVSIKSGDVVAPGKSVEFSASPSSGYTVKSWTKGGITVTGNTSTEYTLTNLSATAVVMVLFELDTGGTGGTGGGGSSFVVTFSVLNGHGTLKATVEGATFFTGSSVENNKTVLFSAIPDAGYKVKAWTRNGTLITGNTSNSYTLYSVASATIIRVEFELATNVSYTVSFNVTGSNGSLRAMVDGAIINTGSPVTKGKSIVFTAAPNPGYRVQSWTRNGTVVSGNTSVNLVLANISSAEFVRVSFELGAQDYNTTADVLDSGGGSSSGSGADNYQVNYSSQYYDIYNQYNNGDVYNENTYNIIDASDWAQAEIQAALWRGFVPEDLQSRYTEGITREEFCRMAVMYVENTMGKFVDEIMSERGVYRNPYAFTDTDDPIIQAAFALGITNGTGPGTFTPDGIFDREQAARMLMNVCMVLGQYVYNAPPSGFDDMEEASDWARMGIDYCYANNIMIGVGNNLFSPNETYSREQSIATFVRIPFF